MAAKKYEVIIDVNSNSVQIAGGEMLSLNQQVRILQKELGNVDGKEFELLSSKLNETKDRASQVNARSRELFSTLSLLPGPIGLFAGKIDGAISLMKVFSGFKLSDVRAQFVALGADIADIGKKIFAATGLQKVFQVTSAATAGVLRAVGIQATAASVGVRAFSTALVATGVGALVVALGYLVTAFMNSEDAGKKYEEQLKQIREEQDKTRQSTENYYEREVANARALGASDLELQRLRLKGLKEVFETSKKNQDDARNALVDAQYMRRKDIEIFEKDYKEKEKIVIEYEQKIALLEADVRNTERIERENANKRREEEERKAIDRRRRQRIEELNALIAIERNKDTRDIQSIQKLRSLIEQRILLEKNEVKLTQEIRQAAAEEALRGAEEERQKDIDSYERALEEKRQANQRFIDKELEDLRYGQYLKEQLLEDYKNIYGESSTQVLQQALVVEQGRRVIFQREAQLLFSYQNTVEGLSKSQRERFYELIGQSDKAIKTEKDFQEQLKRNLGLYGESFNKAYEVLTQLQKAQTEENRKTIQSQREVLQGEFAWQENSIVTFKRRLEIIKELKRLEEQERDVALNATEEAGKQRKEMLNSEFMTVDELNMRILESDRQMNQEQDNIRQNAVKNLRNYSEQEKAIIIARAEYNAQLTNNIANMMSNLSSFIYDLAGKNKKAQKAAVVIDKAAAIGRIVAETSVANAKALQYGLAAPAIITLNNAMAALSIASTVASAVKAVREIDSTSTETGSRGNVINVVARRAMGGIVTGAGTSTSDSIPTLLSNGEFVINANASRMFAPILSQLNSLGNQPQFDMGSLLTQAIGNTTLTSVMAEDAENRMTPPIKTYVSATDMSNQQQMDRLIKSRSTI